MKKYKINIFSFILGAVIFVSITVFAYSYLASDTGYTPRDTTWEVDNVQDALDDLRKGNNEIIEKFINTHWDYKFEETSQEFIVPITGKYKMELWGAKGGNATSTYVGGKGGYISGIITLRKNQRLYVYVGGAGKTCGSASSTCAGGYNGGGSGKAYSQSESRAAGGGGATHISTKDNLLSELADDKDKVLFVAAGGGGGHYTNSSNCGIGGAGGGESGLNATSFCPDNIKFSSTRMPVPATQDTYGCTTSGINCGSFGQGGTTGGSYSGGGAGYYGGSSAEIGPGSGGSSYAISTATSVVNTNGASSMLTHSAESTMTGNNDNGYVKITYLGN